MTTIGQSVPQIDGMKKVTGSPIYVYDLELPGMLFGKILRSPYPHALIKSVNTEQAVKLPGVMAVITAEDTPKQKFSFFQNLADKLPLCDTKVRYIGDEVAAVAAIDLETAEEAIEKIEVQYEELLAVFDPEEAVKPDAPKIHDSGNVAFQTSYEIGEVDKALSKSDLTFKDRFRTQRIAHVCMEPRGCIADWSPDGRLAIISTTQTPHTLRLEVARTLRIRPARVKIVSPPIGGGFGNRLVMSMLEPIAAMLSKHARRPVKIVNTREEEFSTARTRYPFIIDITTGVNRDGKIKAWDVVAVGDNGAYNDKGPAIMRRAGSILGLHYYVENVRFRGMLAYTNTQYCTGFRGFGKPQMEFAVESQLDYIAKELELDPVEMRLKNEIKPFSTTPTGATILSNGTEECIKQACKAIGWEKRSATPNLTRPIARGMGLALGVSPGGGNRKYGYNSADAFLKVSIDGSVTLITGAHDVGTGTHTAIAQIVTDVLGIDIADIAVVSTDTTIMPYDLGVFADRTMFVHGNAAKSACEDVKRELCEVVSKAYSEDLNSIVFDRGTIYSKKNSSQKMSFAEAVQYSYEKLGRPVSGKGRYYDEMAPAGAAGTAPIDPTYSFSCHAAEVEVDLETGKVSVKKYAAAHDSGRILNPLGARSVVLGGVATGLGMALLEAVVIEGGVVTNPNLMDYKIPSVMDMPPVETIFVETNDPLGPLGAKGMGESGGGPVCGAVANAIFNATGVKVRELPMTPVRVLEALDNAKLKR